MTAPSTPQIPDELRPYLDTIAGGVGPWGAERGKCPECSKNREGS